jgi:hypothetical protein
MTDFGGPEGACITLHRRRSSADRRDRARDERLLSLCNDGGLLAEEYEPHARRQFGNFPQAFSDRAARSAASRRAMRGPASSIRGPKSALALRTRGGSRVPQLGTLGSVRGGAQ